MRFLALLALSILAPPASATTCPVVDATGPFWALARNSGGMNDAAQATAFRQRVTGRHPDLYGADLLEIGDPATFDRKSVEALREARRSNFAAETLLRMLQTQIPLEIGKLQRRFPDFRCDFPIYLTISLEQFDAASRIVDGKPALVFGVDAMQALDMKSRLPVFVMHELFHRYHNQVAGFSDETDQEIWRSLWAEGLATFISAAFNLDNSLADALLLPRDLEQTAAPKLPQLAAELRAHADKVDARLFGKYFEYGDKDAQQSGLPWRSAYYVGYRIAAMANERCSVDALAHWDAASVRQEIERDLAFLAGANGTVPAPPCARPRE